MARRRCVYEGREKDLFEGPGPGLLVQHFKDSAWVRRSRKVGVIDGKGVINNRISAYLMTRLTEIRVPTNFVRRLNMREQLIHEVEVLPVEVVVRNIAAGEFAEKFSLTEGTVLPRSIIEFYLRSEDIADPLVSEEHMTAFGWASTHDIDDMVHLSMRVNDFMTGLFTGVGIRLVDFSLTFGRLYHEDDMRLVVADEISPDSCRLWDARTNEPMDKDRFARDLDNVVEGYREVAMRLGILSELNNLSEVPGR
ncbi:MAG: phosphoribosylaminoimidazolesuccinocarboxamide synthase [bacterium]|nr:phosphoribosylaminoimidazolesuccinocarboxamide synthase [bacterium]MDE0241205.1 phosphoribosylaminoimidazolesuccinocarboxamide synthase [bacterium]MDE0415978.1 phosphoribosylaminoimidazolesuccinocarboxamide synthase [bacterium]